MHVHRWLPERKPVISLSPFKPKSRTLKGQLREYARRKEYLRWLSEEYDLDFEGLIIEQEWANLYYGELY